MTTSTDAQVRLRSTIADEAIAAVNVARARRSITPALTLENYRDEAYRQILIDLRAKDIFPADITRPDDLIDAEASLTIALACEAASQRGQSQQQTTVDLFAQEALRWREMYSRAIAKASPVDGLKGHGVTFRWERG